MIEAVVFDCDGLLVDTETPWYEAFCNVYEQYKAKLPLDLYVQCVGSSFEQFDPYHYLEEQTGISVDRNELERTMAKLHREQMDQQPLRPGVADYLQTARQIGLKIGLASSSDRDWVLHHTSRYEIDHYFDVICTSDDVERVKPDPELYRLACDKLGVRPERAIAFEDSANGVEAARTAGMKTVVVPNAITRHLDFGPYDRMIESMADIGLQALLDEMNVHPDSSS